MSGWVKHFSLSSDPFADDSRTWHYYYGADYGPASLKLEHALEEVQGYALVTGPAGTGKSALVRSVVRRSAAYATATVSVSQRPPVAVIDELLRGREPLDNEFTPTRKRAALLDMLSNAERSGRRIICVIEDSHLANTGQLRELVEAINVAPNAASTLLLVLVGRPDLERTLQSRALAGLCTRITTRVETGRLKDEEVAEYLYDRLEHAEAENPMAILPPAATTAIARHSVGIIALAEVLTRTALERAAEAGSRSVTVDLIDEAAQIYARPIDDSPRGGDRAGFGASFGSAPALGLVVMALVVAGAQISMIDRAPTRGDGMRGEEAVLAGMGRLVKLSAVDQKEKASYEPRTPKQLAQKSSPLREKFLEGTPYEVQIKAPQDPNKPAPKAPMPAAPAAAPAAPAKPAPAATGPTSIQKTMQAVGKSSGPAVKTSSGKPAPSAKPRVMGNKPPAGMAKASPPKPATGARFALQVGAFRELRSAIELKGRLARSFEGVYVSTVESGGEPLYRIRVGSFAKAEDTERLKAKLQATGFPSFRVSETKR